MPNTTRRAFLKNSITSATAVAAALHASRIMAASPAPQMKFPTDPRARLAASTWPFRGYMDNPQNPWRNPKLKGMGLIDFPAFAVKNFNLHNIEALSEHFPSTDSAWLQKFRAAISKANSHIVDIAIESRASFYDPFKMRRQEAVDHAKQWVDVAVQVGSPSIRTGIAGGKSFVPDVDRAAESLAQVAAYGASRNVIINLENDDLVTEDAFFLVKVIDKAATPWLRALPDFANSALAGIPGFDYDAMAVMFRHAYNISHMKDSEVGDGNKLYKVDVSRILRIAKANHYRGYYSLEWEGREDPFTGTRRLLQESLKYL